MKTSAILTLVALAISGHALRAADKLDSSKKTVERIIQAQPTVATPSTRTPVQAAQEYKNSGPAPNNARGGLHIKEPPVPGARR